MESTSSMKMMLGACSLQRAVGGIESTSYMKVMLGACSMQGCRWVNSARRSAAHSASRRLRPPDAALLRGQAHRPPAFLASPRATCRAGVHAGSRGSPGHAKELPHHAAALANALLNHWQPGSPGHDKELPHHAAAFANILLNQLSATDSDEGAVGMVRHRARKQCLARAGRPVEQHALRHGARERNCDLLSRPATRRSPAAPPPLLCCSPALSLLLQLLLQLPPLLPARLGLRDAQRVEELRVLQRQLNHLRTAHSVPRSGMGHGRWQAQARRAARRGRSAGAGAAQARRAACWAHESGRSTGQAGAPP